MVLGYSGYRCLEILEARRADARGNGQDDPDLHQVAAWPFKHGSNDPDTVGSTMGDIFI